MTSTTQLRRIAGRSVADDGHLGPSNGATVKKKKNTPSEPIGNARDLSLAVTLGAVARNLAS